MHTSAAHPLAQHSSEGITMDIETPKPTIELVHGAVEDSSLWTHGVIQGLQRDGYMVKVFSNPLRGLAVDAAYLRSLLDTIEGPVILVSHAYGGAIITQAGDAPKVKGLVSDPIHLARRNQRHERPHQSRQVRLSPRRRRP
jgi:pimeloyl-ACP methyl ester carboxylesterase